MSEITWHASIAAKLSGLKPAIVRESEGIPQADLLIVPSNKALLGNTFPALLDRAKEGAHVYVSWFAGSSMSQRGAWWPDIEPIFAARHRLRYGIAESTDDVVTFTFQVALGDIGQGESLEFRAAGGEYARSHLPLEVIDAEVIAVDGSGNPALIRRRVGAGFIYLGAFPIEYFGAVRRNANEDDQVYRLYAALAAEAGIVPEVRVPGSRTYVDQLEHADGTRFSWLVSLDPEPAVVAPLLAAGTRLIDVLSGEDVTQKCALPSFGVRVARHVVHGR